MYCILNYAVANSYLRYGILAWGNATDSIITGGGVRIAVLAHMPTL